MSNSSDDINTGPRIVSRQQDRREPPVAPDAAATEATDVYPHLYEVTGVPEGCTDYEVGDRIELYVAEPPPATVVVHVEGPCDGMTATLVA